MRRSGDDRHSLFPRKAGDYTSERRQILAGLLNIRADARADLDHRLDHLGLDLFAEEKFAFFEDLGNMRL